MRLYLNTLLIPILFVGCSSLPYTIEKGDMAGARAMINDGADVKNTTDCFHALTIAAMKGDKDLVQLLLDKGADVNARSNECDYTENLAGMKWRFRWGSRTALDRAANADIAAILLKAGANPNISGYRQYKGWTDLDTALVNAVSSSDLALVKILVEGGANVNARGRRGENLALSRATAISSIAQKLNESRAADAAAIVQYLTSKGAQNTPLSDQAAASTEGKILTRYRHVATGAVTDMSPDIAKAVYDHPERFSGLTVNAADQKTYHYSEFVWSETGQNVFDWYLLRLKKTGNLK